jgi:hypothetical protein
MLTQVHKVIHKVVSTFDQGWRKSELFLTENQ